MPYVSDAQRRWAHTKKGKKALGGKAAVHEWDEATKGKALPERVEKASAPQHIAYVQPHSLYHPASNEGSSLNHDWDAFYAGPGKHTHDPAKAMKFHSPMEAKAHIRSVSEAGKHEQPLNAYKFTTHDSSIEKGDIHTGISAIDKSPYSKVDRSKPVKKEETADPVAGMEPLKKPKKTMMKSILDRWSLMKADLNNEESIMDQSGDEDDEQDQEAAGGPMDAASQNSDDADASADQEQVVAHAGSGGGEPAEDDSSEPTEIGDEETPDQETGADEEEDPGASGDPEAIAQALKEIGYSDEEIEKLMADEDQEGQDMSKDRGVPEVDEATEEMNRPALDHPNAMSQKFQLELDALKRRQDIELKYLEEELKQKLNHTEESHKQKLGHNDEDAKIRRAAQEKKAEADAKAKAVEKKKPTAKKEPK